MGPRAHRGAPTDLVAYYRHGRVERPAPKPKNRYVAPVSPIASPKQPPQERLKDWYPYYAGYTSAFAESVFDQYLGSAKSVVDPWNGSGTTTAVAASRGVT